MRYAIIACIHANLPALKAVLDDIKAQNCTHVACLGDLSGYHAHPKECVDIIRSMNIPCVKGNHDEYCSTDLALQGFQPRAMENILWTREQLSAEDRHWLRDLPQVLTLHGFTLVHATLDRPERWGYVFDKLAAAAHFSHQLTRVCFFGHTHLPAAFIRDRNSVRGGTFSKFKLENAPQYLVNVGSVGQPRDNNPRASYVVYDLDDQWIELRRVDYPRPDGGDRGSVGGPLPVKTSPGAGPPSAHASEEQDPF
jgi:predicted phosphodiesterase